MSDISQNTSPAINFAVLIVLLLALSFVLVHFNILSCGFYSEIGCEIYYSIIAGGKPKILIVHGDEGIGDPQFLFETLRSPRFSARVSIKDLEIISAPDLFDQQLVIVEKARVMNTSQIRMFQDYVNRGGRLIWIADAGVSAPFEQSDQNYFLKFKERKAGGSDEFIGPWARKSGNNQVSFDNLLGVNFKANYCEIVLCTSGVVGALDITEQNNYLANGLSENLAIYGDFSLVQINESSVQTSVAYLDYGTGLIGTAPSNYFWLDKKRHNFGNSFPVIISSGVGKRVAYYAFAPEYFVSESMPLDPQGGKRIAYWALIENMYYGMLYKK